MRIWSRRNFYLYTIVAILIVVSAIGYKETQLPPRIRLTVIEWPGYAPALYAQILGLYKKNNLPIDVVFSSSPVDSTGRMTDEKVEGISTVLSDLILLRSNGVPAQALLFTDYSQAADSLVARPEIKNVEQLKGKTIGIDALNSFSHVFVLKTLERHGLTERDVQFKVVPFDQVTDALQANTVQAAHTWDPGLGQALRGGYHRIATAGEIPNIVLDCIAFREDLLKQYPEIFKKFIDVFYEAQTQMLADPEGAARKMESFYHNDPQEFAAEFKELHFIDARENLQRWQDSSDDSFLKQAQSLSEFFLKRGQTSEADLHEKFKADGYYP